MRHILLVSMLLAPLVVAQEEPLWTYRGAFDEDFAGDSVSAVGDLDGDGVGDLLFGADGFDGGAGRDTGRVTAISAATRDILWRVEGPVPFAYLGVRLAALGDVNGDGVEDWIGGTWYGSEGGPGAGAAYVGDGATGQILRTHLGAPDGNGDGFGDSLGFSVAGLGDVDGDGTRDYAIGAIGDYLDGPTCLDVDDDGYFAVHSGATGTELYRITGTSGCMAAGYTMAGVPDLDGDGRADLVVGFPELSLTPGRVELRSGATGGLLRTHLGPANGSFFGIEVAAVGDIDGDGTEDYAGGATGSGHPILPAYGGLVSVYSGRDGSRIRDYAAPEPALGNGFGRGIVAHDDENGDGTPELLVGAAFVGAPNASSGRSYVIDGASGAALRRVTGEPMEANLGYGARLTSLADLDGDGRREIVDGTWTSSTHGPQRGRVTIHASGGWSHWASRNVVSLASPDPVGFAVTGPPLAGYGVVASFGGTGSSTMIGPINLPLADDAWLRLTLDPATTPIRSGFGRLAANGRATAALPIPSNLPPSIAGARHTSVAVVVDAMLQVHVSEPVDVVLVP